MKKYIATLLVTILTLALLAACSGGGGSNNNNSSSNSSNTPSSTPSDNNTPSSTSNNTPVNTASTKIEYDQVIWDDQDIKITLTGYMRRELWEDYCFYFTIENNSDKDIMSRFVHTSVNGCMVSWTNYSENTGTKAGETRDDTKLFFGIEYLKTRGITEIQEVEFSLQFFEDVMPYVTPLFSSESITISGPADPGYVQTYDVDGVVALDENGIKITVTELELTTIQGFNHYIYALIENNSGIDIYVSGSGGGGELLPSDILNGKVALTAFSYSTGSISPADRAESLTKPDGIVLQFTVRDIDDHSTIYAHEKQITVKFDSMGKIIK